MAQAKREGETCGLQDEGKRLKLITEEENGDNQSTISVISTVSYNTSQPKKQGQQSGVKRTRKKGKRATKKLTLHELTEKGMKNMKDTFSKQKTKDRQSWDKHVENLMKTISDEREKDRKFWDKHVENLMKKISVERETDRQFWMIQTDKWKKKIGDSQEDMNTKDEDSLYYGTSDTQVSEGGEDDLKKHFDDCQKNPGHTKFVPVNDFNSSHLPESYRDDVIVELIKATAALTVRVDVKMTSDKRPSVWPNTDKPFAFSDDPKSTVMRVGTGMVYSVNIFKEKFNTAFKKGPCTCRKCLGPQAGTPSKSWGLVHMITENELVFDDLEAQHTSSKFFYDTVESSPTHLDGWKVKEQSNEQGLRELTCVTCDMDLLNRLHNFIELWRGLCGKVNDKYKSSTAGDKLIFMVSHPHGCPKHVSLGTLISSSETVDGWTKYLYTTDTCKGSCGAYTHVIGFNNTWTPPCCHVHRGVNSDETSFSCAGVEAI